MKRGVLVLGVLLAFALATAGLATHSPWPDARHGWEVRCDRDGVCSLYSTEDGGRHWHVIFDGEVDDIMGFLRTSARAGLISINYKSPEQYWTRDNGRHWYFTRRIPAFWAGGLNLAGKGHSLFWSRRHVLYQVTNWPPRRRTELRLRLVERFRDGSFTDLAWIPSGVAGTVLRDPAAPTAPLVRVVLRKRRSNAIVRLRDPDPVRAARVASLTLFASWPELTVLGEDDHGNPVVGGGPTTGGGAGRARSRLKA